ISHQARPYIVSLTACWNDHQRSQLALPRSRQNLIEPGSDHILPGFLQGWHNEQKRPRSFHRLRILHIILLSPRRRVTPSRSSRSSNGTITRRELPSAWRNWLTVDGPFLEMNSVTWDFMRSKLSRNSTTSRASSVTSPFSIKKRTTCRACGSDSIALREGGSHGCPVSASRIRFSTGWTWTGRGGTWAV